MRRKQPKKRQRKTGSKCAKECMAAQLLQIQLCRSRLHWAATQQLIQRQGREKGYLV